MKGPIEKELIRTRDQETQHINNMNYYHRDIFVQEENKSNKNIPKQQEIIQYKITCNDLNESNVIQVCEYF